MRADIRHIRHTHWAIALVMLCADDEQYVTARNNVLLSPTAAGVWIAFLVGLTAAIAIDRRRLQLVTTMLVLTPWPILAIWAASTSPALTHSDRRSKRPAATATDWR